MGFRVGPFVLCKNGCWRRRRTNTNFGPKKFFPPIIPPHLSNQNDQRAVGIILSHRCWVDPPPPRHGRSGTPALNPPSRHGGQGGGRGGWENGLPPPAEQFSSRPVWSQTPPPTSSLLLPLLSWQASRALTSALHRTGQMAGPRPARCLGPQCRAFFSGNFFLLFEKRRAPIAVGHPLTTFGYSSTTVTWLQPPSVTLQPLLATLLRWSAFTRRPIVGGLENYSCRCRTLCN